MIFFIVKELFSVVFGILGVAIGLVLYIYVKIILKSRCRYNIPKILDSAIFFLLTIGLGLLLSSIVEFL